jgi:type VI secretion system secreted protein VgrG
MEVVPHHRLHTRKARSRKLQQHSVPDILKKVFDGLDFEPRLQGRYEPRDYCVQYRESDFNFATRLMEEEGIYYYFLHADGKDTLVYADSPSGHSMLPVGSTVLYDEGKMGEKDEDTVFDWHKTQEMRSGKYTLWDHCFELPGNNLEAQTLMMDSVAVGKVSHKLRVENDKLEIYDYPGEYAGRYDGIAKGGGEQPAELQKIFEDSRRTVGIRMDQETVPSVILHGSSTCRQLIAGHKMNLSGHFNGDGQYVLMSVSHSASQTGGFRAESSPFVYHNTFTCIPVALPFRSPRVTPKPVIQGTQTAVVVGPAGDEIFTDKYSRVKVQFNWDREGKFDPDSSCWIRVSTAWAGRRWGQINIPRIGQEVIVGFLEGDPDQPIILGSVYNADQMPALTLPPGSVTSGLKSNSTKGGGGYNQMTMDDTKGKEMITIHAQYDMSTTVEHDDTQLIKNDRSINVLGTHTESIKKDTKITVTDGNYTFDVAKGTADIHVKGAVTEFFEDVHATYVTNAITIISKTKTIYVQAAEEIELTVGASTLLMKKDGTIKLVGTNIAVDGSAKVRLHSADIASEADVQHSTKGAIVLSEGSATNTIKGGMVMLNP